MLTAGFLHVIRWIRRCQPHLVLSLAVARIARRVTSPLLGAAVAHLGCRWLGCRSAPLSLGCILAAACSHAGAALGRAQWRSLQASTRRVACWSHRRRGILALSWAAFSYQLLLGSVAAQRCRRLGGQAGACPHARASLNGARECPPRAPLHAAGWLSCRPAPPTQLRS